LICSPVQCCSIDACPPRPFGNRQRFAESRHNVAALFNQFTAVGILITNGRPSAISRFVIAVVVDTIKRVVFRTLAHVGKKVIEFSPTFTNANTATTVMFPSSGFGISAPLQHGVPRSVSRMIGHAMRSDGISSPTSARLRWSRGTQLRRAQDCFVSAGTLTAPMHQSVFVPHPLNHGEPIKLFPDKVFEYWHAVIVTYWFQCVKGVRA